MGGRCRLAPYVDHVQSAVILSDALQSDGCNAAVTRRRAPGGRLMPGCVHAARMTESDASRDNAAGPSIDLRDPERMTAPRLWLGYSLSSEEHGPGELVELARRAEEAGFGYISLSDHLHPWVTAQGHSPFAWSVLGAVAMATRRAIVGTGVTCPVGRYHPAIVAQAAATVAGLMPGRFYLGVGTGEALNEHVTGAHWPPYPVRAARLEEAVSVIRDLWTGRLVDRRGTHVTVENTRLYDAPVPPPPIIVAASGLKAARLAARIGDGLITPAAKPEIARAFREGSDGPRFLQVNVCWDADEAEARRLAHERCATVALPGELGHLIPNPSQYEQAVGLVSQDDVAKVIVCGPDVERHVEVIRRGVDAGYDHIHVYQVGPRHEGFFRFYEREVIPRLAA
jgi:G6PDH family F420-dependent oxidoreductase